MARNTENLHFMVHFNWETVDYHKALSQIRSCTCGMYKHITECLIHSDSPIELVSLMTDFWETVCADLQNNRRITHIQFVVLVNRIDTLMRELYSTFSMEYPYE